MRAVFLDRQSLPVRFTQPAAVTDYVEYAATSTDQVVARLQDASVAIINKVALREASLAQLPSLKLIAIAATGYDCVDIPYCRANGITVVNIRDYAVNAVPEHVFALLLALRRNLMGYREAVTQGAWENASQFCVFKGTIRDLNHSVLGLVGRGSIAKAVAKIAVGFGMRVFYSHPTAAANDAESKSLSELLALSDVISLHCPLTPATRGMIGEAELRSMKPDAILINTARGGLVDEPALARALTEGWIGGAGLDVLSTEPPREGNALLDLNLPNFILTPHVAWASIEAMEGLADQLTENIAAWAAGAPRHIVGQ